TIDTAPSPGPSFSIGPPVFVTGARASPQAARATTPKASETPGLMRVPLSVEARSITRGRRTTGTSLAEARPLERLPLRGRHVLDLEEAQPAVVDHRSRHRSGPQQLALVERAPRDDEVG